MVVSDAILLQLNKLDTIVENQGHLEQTHEQLTRMLLSSTLSARIIIQSTIPKGLRNHGTIHGSRVGTGGDEGKLITEFIKNQLLPITHDDWETPELPACADDFNIPIIARATLASYPI